MSDAKVTVYLTAQDAFSTQLDAFKRKMGEVAGGMTFTTSASGRWEEGLRKLAQQQSDSNELMVKGVTAGAEWSRGLDKAGNAVTNLAGNLLGANNQASNIAEGLLTSLGAGGPVVAAVAAGLAVIGLAIKAATAETDLMTIAFERQQKAVGDLIQKWSGLGDSQFDATKRGLELQRLQIQTQIRYLEVLTLTNKAKVPDLIEASKALIAVDAALADLQKKTQDAFAEIPKAPIITWAEGVKAAIQDVDFALQDVLLNGARLGQNMGALPGFQQGATPGQEGEMVTRANRGGPSDAMLGAGGQRGLSGSARQYQEQLSAVFDPILGAVNTFRMDLATAISDAFVTAFQTGSVTKAMDSFGKAVLGAMGAVFTKMGETYLKFSAIMKPLTKLLFSPPTSAWAAAAIGVALMALGKALGSLATSGGGGGGGGGGATTFTSTQSNVAKQQAGRMTLVVDEDLAMNPLHPRSVEWVAKAFGEAVGMSVIIVPKRAISQT